MQVSSKMIASFVKMIASFFKMIASFVKNDCKFRQPQLRITSGATTTSHNFGCDHYFDENHTNLALLQREPYEPRTTSSTTRATINYYFVREGDAIINFKLLTRTSNFAETSEPESFLWPYRTLRLQTSSTTSATQDTRLSARSRLAVSLRGR